MQRQDRKRGTNIKFKSDINSCRNSCSLSEWSFYLLCFANTQEMYVNTGRRFVSNFIYTYIINKLDGIQCIKLWTPHAYLLSALARSVHR